MPEELQSCLYQGLVRHRRFAPREHSFTYKLYMVFLDLGELDRVFAKRWLWSIERRTPISFRRADHLGNPAQPLCDAVRDLVARRTGNRPDGRIAILTHLRHFGYCFNPVSFYYIYLKDSQEIETIVAEVNNTPWGERHCYVFPAKQSACKEDRFRYRFPKQFHVSPFMPINIDYDWAFTAPGRNLNIHMINYKASEKVFDATMTLQRRGINGRSLASAVVHFPFMTGKVIAAIYWEALRLKLKRLPFFPHPSNAIPLKEHTTHENV